MTNQKQFGVWMDSHNAAIVGKAGTEAGEFVLLAHVKGEQVAPNSSEKTEHNHQRTTEGKFFKEITSHMQNATYIHLTGTGVAQEKFMHYLADTPQFKNTKTEESTSNKMSDEKLIEYLVGKFN
jgi:stalled ribosome rescue protein Dom34